MSTKKKSFADKGRSILDRKAKPSSMTEFMDNDKQTASHNAVNTAIQNDVNTETHKPVKKTVQIEYELNEKLREVAFRERTTERDLIEEGLRLLFKKKSV